jgi:hypothetical protein
VRSTKALYLVAASTCEPEMFDSMVVVARTKKEAVEATLRREPGETGVYLPCLDVSQEPFLVKRLDPARCKIGARIIASFNAGL